MWHEKWGDTSTDAGMSPRLANAISAHSWSPDETTLALSPNSSDIHVYQASEQGVLTKQCTLREHSQLVSDIHWNREGSFASCSHDSSAYVWTRNGDAWKPELVRIVSIIHYEERCSLHAQTSKNTDVHLGIYSKDGPP